MSREMNVSSDTLSMVFHYIMTKYFLKKGLKAFE